MLRSVIFLAASVVFLVPSSNTASANGGSWRGWAINARAPGFSFSVGRPRAYGYSSAYYGGYYPRYNYRPYVYYRPIYTDYYYAPPAYYYAPPVYSYYVPIAAEVSTYPAAQSLSTVRPRIETIDPARFMLPVPNNGTFFYDGGPSIPVPMTNEVKATTPRELAPTQHRYLAYGEQPEAPRRDVARTAEPPVVPLLGEAGAGFSGGTMIFTQAQR
jgi:hypothetical protein